MCSCRPRSQISRRPIDSRSIAADLTDAQGRALDGNDDGQPGGNYVAIVTKNGVTPAAVAAPAIVMARAVDAAIEKNELLNAAPAHRGLESVARFRAR